MILKELDLKEKQNSARGKEQIFDPLDLGDNLAEKSSEIKKTKGISFICSLCKDFIIHSMTTICNHSFCQLCVGQYLLFIDECPDCTTQIRSQRISSNILFDNLILDYIKKYDPMSGQRYHQRLEQYKQNKKKKVVEQLEAGDQIDVRDNDYVWCTGKVIRTFNKIHEKKIKYIVVKYDLSKKKQEIPEISPRVAPKGFYTNRQDVPKYQDGKILIKNKRNNLKYVVPKIENKSLEIKKDDSQ